MGLIKAIGETIKETVKKSTKKPPPRPEPIRIIVEQPPEPSNREQVKRWINGGDKPQRLVKMEDNIREMFGDSRSPSRRYDGGNQRKSKRNQDNPFVAKERRQGSKKNNCFDVNSMFRNKL